MNSFNAIADKNRRKIIEILANDGELSVQEIKKEFSISAPAISQHLKVLKNANLIKVKKKAQRRLYSIDENGIIQIATWLDKVRIKWEKRLDRLDSYLLTNFKKENDKDV